MRVLVDGDSRSACRSKGDGLQTSAVEPGTGLARRKERMRDWVGVEREKSRDSAWFVRFRHCGLYHVES
jgi:hypothetical protein